MASQERKPEPESSGEDYWNSENDPSEDESTEQAVESEEENKKLARVVEGLMQIIKGSISRRIQEEEEEEGGRKGRSRRDSSA